METHQKTLGLEHPENQTMAMMIMKIMRIMREERAGVIRLLQIKEDETRDPQITRGRKKRGVFLVY